MIELTGSVVLIAVVSLAVLIPAIVFLDRRAAYRTAQVLAVAAVTLICVLLAGIIVLVMADGRPS